MVYCIHCGQQNPDDAVQCSNCGKRLQHPTRRGEPTEYRPRPARRSSDVCWEDEFRGRRELDRGGLLVIGIVFILIAVMIYSAIFYTADFEAFWENFGRTLENFFGSQSFETFAMLIGPIIMALIGLAFIIAALRKS